MDYDPARPPSRPASTPARSTRWAAYWLVGILAAAGLHAPAPWSVVFAVASPTAC